MNNPRIFISAGEVSGDLAGASLISALRRSVPGVSIFGLGGPRMREAGAELEGDSLRLGAVGVTEGLATLPSVVRQFQRVRAQVQSERPDVAVLIGNDLFNLAIARCLRRRAIPVVSYFPPQVWIWRALARPIASSFDMIATSFPDEDQVYRSSARRTKVVFVGHYLAEMLPPATESIRADARRRLGLHESGPIVVLMPGSRRHEVRAIAPALLEAANRLVQQEAHLQLLLPAAEPDQREGLSTIVAHHGLTERCRIVASSHDALYAGDLVILASGTASLEAALVGLPMIIVYRTSRTTHAALKVFNQLGLVDARVYGLPNLIAGQPIVPELLQSALTPDAVAREALLLLRDERRRATICQALGRVRERVTSRSCLEQVSDLVIEAARGDA